jgi:hypothetical protein
MMLLRPGMLFTADENLQIPVYGSPDCNVSSDFLGFINEEGPAIVIEVKEMRDGTWIKLITASMCMCWAKYHHFHDFKVIS